MISEDLSQERIAVGLNVDRLFKDYLLEMTPNEAILFMSAAAIVKREDREKVCELLRRVNSMIPVSELKGSEPGHTYRVGRSIDRRIIYLRLHSAHTPNGFRATDLLQDLEKQATTADALYQVGSDDAEWEFMFWWI